KTNSQNNMNILFGSIIISIISSIIFSFFENLGTSNPCLFITISIITKLALGVIAPLALLLTLMILPVSKKDARYRDGTKYNQRSKNIAVITSVFAALILSLVKNHE
ncbi:MAG: hypothetical protein IK094_07915, partial [Treponema sp.]|nr:hypothetical protein [Treponema sp.]